MILSQIQTEKTALWNQKLTTSGSFQVETEWRSMRNNVDENSPSDGDIGTLEY